MVDIQKSDKDKKDLKREAKKTGMAMESFQTSQCSILS